MSEHFIYKRLYMLYVGHTINRNLKYDDDIALDRLEQHTDRLFFYNYFGSETYRLIVTPPSDVICCIFIR